MASTEFENRVQELVDEISYKDDYFLDTQLDKNDPEGRIYIQVVCFRPDSTTKARGEGRGGKIYLSEHMTDSEIVRKAFQAFQAYEEHECREWFRYIGRQVFGPHISVQALWEVSERLDIRE